jgi:hypothetical protein
MPKSFHGFPIFQYAWVVNNLDESCHRWVKAFGAGPFFTARHHKAEGYYRYRGDPKECDLSYAFGYCGSVMIQLIELHDDTPSIFHDMYKRGEEGFHHVAVLGYDFPKTRKHLLDQGLEIANEMWSGADVVYFDARPQFGMFVEIHGAPQPILDHFARLQHEHDQWDGVTNPIRDAIPLEKQHA